MRNPSILYLAVSTGPIFTRAVNTLDRTAKIHTFVWWSLANLCTQCRYRSWTSGFGCVCWIHIYTHINTLHGGSAWIHALFPEARVLRSRAKIYIRAKRVGAARHVPCEG